MIDIPVEDLVFAVCTLVGVGLLLITVVVDDILGAILHFGVGGVSLMPLLLSFVSMFGVGGLFATQVLDIHGGQAAIIGSGFGLAGLGVAYLLFGALRRAPANEGFSSRDLIGDDAYVSVGFAAGQYGNVVVRKEGQTREFSATSSSDIASGTNARVTGVAGVGLIVEPVPVPTATRGDSADPGGR